METLINLIKTTFTHHPAIMITGGYILTVAMVMTLAAKNCVSEKEMYGEVKNGSRYAFLVLCFGLAVVAILWLAYWHSHVAPKYLDPIINHSEITKQTLNDR